MLACATVPSFLNARFRFLDFFVRMWRLKDFWCVIFPVPVTLKRFLALEFVFTLGIFECCYSYTLEALPLRRKTWGASSGNTPFQEGCKGKVWQLNIKG